MRVAIYARISQDREGTEVGVANQEKTSRAIAESLGASAITVYVDNDRGASSRSKKSRPEFDRMLADAGKGAFDFIVAYSMSRLTRRPLEWESLIQLAEKKGVQYRFQVSPTFDLTKADGRATARTIAAWDAAEAERTGERVQHAQQAKLAVGLDSGGPRPFGYTLDRQSLVEKEADALRWAYQEVLNGGSLVAIAREFTDRGLERDRAKENSWRPQTIRNMLLRPRNMGHLIVKGTLYSTDLPAIVDEETFHTVTAILQNPSRRPTKGRVPTKQPLTGLVRCDVCGNYLRLAAARGVTYLKCAKDGRPIETAKLTHPTMKLESAELEMSFHVLARLSILANNHIEFSSTTPTKDLQMKMVELRRQRDLAQEMIFEPGANVPTLKAKIAALGLELDELQVEHDTAVSANIGGAAIEVARLFLLNKTEDDHWGDYWNSLEVESKKALIRALMPNARLLKAGSKGSFRIQADDLPSIQKLNE